MLSGVYRRGSDKSLSFIEGLKITDIAEQLNVSESTVKKTKAKALDILREKLPRELFLFFFVLKS